MAWPLGQSVTELASNVTRYGETKTEYFRPANTVEHCQIHIYARCWSVQNAIQPIDLRRHLVSLNMPWSLALPSSMQPLHYIVAIAIPVSNTAGNVWGDSLRPPFGSELWNFGGNNLYGRQLIFKTEVSVIVFIGKRRPREGKGEGWLLSHRRNLQRK